jgi:hypothetical protein
MAERKESTKTGFMGSKYWRMLLVVLMALFTFGAPYVAYIANHFLKRGVFFSFAAGLVSFVIGSLLLWYLVRNKVIS